MIKVITSTQRIIRRMAEMKDMYKITKYINSNRYSKLCTTLATVEAGEALDLTVADYRAYRWINKPTLNKALAYINLTKKDRYINWLDRDKKMLHVTSEGHHLVGKRLYFFRVGLWDESLKHYDKTQTVIIIILTSVIAAVGGTIIGYILGVR